MWLCICIYIYIHNVLLFEFTTHPVGVTKKSQVDELAKTIGLKFRQDTAGIGLVRDEWPAKKGVLSGFIPYIYM